MEKQKRIVKRIVIALLLLVTNIHLSGCMSINDSSSGSSQSSEQNNTNPENSSSADGNGDSETSEIVVEGDGIMKDPYDDFD